MFAHKSLTLILDNGEVDAFETILVLDKVIEGTDDDCAG